MNEKISCSIINDLIPLYMDNAASEESRALVESHISECSDCRNIMESMNTVINDISDKDAALFKKVKMLFGAKTKDGKLTVNTILDNTLLSRDFKIFCLLRTYPKTIINVGTNIISTGVGKCLPPE